MKIRERVIALMKERIEADAWDVVGRYPMLSCRWTRTQPTPEFIREGSASPYPFENYDRHVFLTFVSQGGPIIMRVCAAPWVNCQDTSPPLWLVEEVLKDPELAFDTKRVLDMRHARRGGRGGDGVRR